MKKLTGTEVERAESRGIITTAETKNWWVDPETRILVKESDLMSFLNVKDDVEITARISENDLARKRGRALFDYNNIPGIIKF